MFPGSWEMLALLLWDTTNGCWLCAQDRLGPGAAKSSQNLQENAGGMFLSIFPAHSKILLPSPQGW